MIISCIPLPPLCSTTSVFVGLSDRARNSLACEFETDFPLRFKRINSFLVAKYRDCNIAGMDAR